MILIILGSKHDAFQVQNLTYIWNKKQMKTTEFNSKQYSWGSEIINLLWGKFKERFLKKAFMQDH